jgi:hypothetical protein
MPVPAITASAALTAKAASASASAVGPAAIASLPGSAIAWSTAPHHSWGSIFSADYFYANPQVAGSLLSIAGSAFVGIMTLFGVGITLWVNRAGLLKQLRASEDEAQRNRDFTVRQASEDREHSRKEAAIDRENSASQEHVARLMEMRKVLYQKLIEEHQKAVALIASLPTVPITEISAAPTKLLGYAAAAQKTMLISEVSTSRAATDAHAKVNEFLFSMFPRLIPLAIAQTDIDEAAKRLASNREQLALLNAEFGTVTPENISNWGRFKFNSDKLSTDFERLAGLQQAAHANRNALLAEYQDSLMSQLHDVHRPFASFLALARTELGLPGGAEELRLQTEEMFARASAAMAKFKADVAKMQS